MFLKNYSLINYILYKNRREFENSFDCYPKKTVYEFYIRESAGGMKIRQKEHNAIHVSLVSSRGNYVTLYEFYARRFGDCDEFFNQAEERTWI